MNIKRFSYTVAAILASGFTVFFLHTPRAYAGCNSGWSRLDPTCPGRIFGPPVNNDADIPRQIPMRRKPPTSNKFSVRNRWNPYCLVSSGNSKAVDNPVVMGACGESNAVWSWDGQQIKNGLNPYCLGSIGNSEAVDNPVVMGACGQSNAVWSWDGQQIKNGLNPYCLGSIGNSKAVDNPVVMGACGQSNAQWYIEPIR